MDEELVKRLCVASVEKSHFPEIDIDWNLTVNPDVLPIPESLISIYGLPEYSRMSEQNRVKLACHELASIFSTLIRLESILTSRFARLIQRAHVSGPVLSFLLHEIEEEARHSRMFLRGIRMLGVRSYPATGVISATENMITTLTNVPIFLLLMILASEEMPDLIFQRIAGAPNASPVLRRICQIHRIEEARHIVFAREYFRDLYSEASAPARASLQVIAPSLIAADFDGLVQPEVYKHAGVVAGMADAWRLWWKARGSEHRSQLRQASIRRLAAFLTDVGVIGPRTRSSWVAHGLIATGTA